jgi:Bifunctional DNA primase/polymerase, N-terminal/AAA domain/Primase C terminal 1 (PriCT-1)
MNAPNACHQAALGYARRGWRVLPLHVPQDGGCSCRYGADCPTPGKHPRVMEWEKKATTDAAQIDQWWSMWPDSNVAIVCGNGLLVLDVDVDKAKGVDGFAVLAKYQQRHGSFQTASVVTGSDAGHFYFTAPANAPSFDIADGLEVHAAGRIVVAPPSLHASGRRYAWLNGTDPAPAPAWLLRKSRTAPLKPGEKVGKGRRHKAMLSLAGAMRRQDADQATIEAALLKFNQRRCDPPKDEAVVRELAADVAKRYAPAEEAVPSHEKSHGTASDSAEESAEAAGLSHEKSHGTAEVQPNGGTVSPSHAPRESGVVGQSDDFVHRRIDPATFRPLTFAWQRRLVVGVLNLFGGEEGVGKGTIESYTIAQLTLGTLPGSLYGKPARVLWIGDEDSVGEVVGPRLMAAGADLDWFEEVASASDALLNVTHQADALERLIRSGPFQVVVFEALLDNLPALRNPNDPHEIRTVLHPLRGVLRRTRATGLGTFHTRKGEAKTFREALAGSHQFNALSRSSMLVAHHPDGSGRRVLIGGKVNYSRHATPLSFAIQPAIFELNGQDFDVSKAIDIREEADLTIEDALAGPPGKRERDQADRRELVLAALTDHGQSVRSVATATRLSVSTTGRYLSQLVDDGLAVHGSDGFKSAARDG